MRYSPVCDVMMYTVRFQMNKNPDHLIQRHAFIHIMPIFMGLIFIFWFKYCAALIAAQCILVA